jgi:U3 small nucleolar RNA-associated protein 14
LEIYIQVDEELASNAMSAEEWQRRQDTMAKNNALLFYQEQKAKRLKKIKSKAYHKHSKKSAQAGKDALDIAALNDPDTLQVLSVEIQTKSRK